MQESQILDKLKARYNEEDFSFIFGAYQFAKKYHEGQTRASGEPYIMHPLNVALILADLGMDCVCLAAAILHDVVEDTACTKEDISKKFGKDVCLMVMGVTKLSKIKMSSNTQDTQAESYRNMFLAIAEDNRVLFIKLADRLHNMRTLSALPPEKQQRIARETLNLYAPLAGRLGISHIKCELEDLSMKYLFPEDYAEIVKAVESRVGERMGFVMRIANEIEIELNELNLVGEVRGRQKHLYSIYKKIKYQNKTIDQIYDLIAVRVIVETVRDCYTMLGVIHSKWKPVPMRFKDYIAMPKPNLYQSLHTTVMTEFGQMFEIQIRTYEMNKIAEYGIAAHWVYKEVQSGDSLRGIQPREAKGYDVKDDARYDKELGWVKEVAESDAKSSQEFLDTIKLNLEHEVYVFTPKGTVVNLPKGANCIDFAFKVHTEVGNKCVGAKVDNKIVPLSTVLETGQMVEVLTSNSSKGPSRDWLKIVVTPQAKTKIKAFFKKEMETANIKTGKDMLEREARHRGYALSDLLSTTGMLDKIMTRYSVQSLEDLYGAVGYGSLTTNQILVKLIDSYKKEQALKKALEPDTQTTDTVYRKAHGGILIEGMDGFAIKLARCCNPVPGDKIVGYAARGTGVSVHRTDCPNVKGMEKERLLKAEWAENDNTFFNAQLRIESEDKNGLLNEIVALIAQQGLSISSIEARTKKAPANAVIALGVMIKSVEDLTYLMNKIDALDGVLSVTRNS